MKVDNELVVRASRGEKDAFTDLYNLCYKDLYKYALYILGNTEDAADAVSDTFLESWRGISKLREPEAFPSWIFRILSLRCKRGIKVLIDRRNTFNIDDLIETPEENSDGIEETVSESTALAEALAKLTPEERMIIILSVLHGYTNKEIAEILEKPQGTIGSKLSRTYAKLREMLGGEQ